MVHTATDTRALSTREAQEALREGNVGDVSVIGSELFEARIRDIVVDGMRLSRLRISPHHGHSRHRGPARGFLVVNYQLRGEATFSQDGMQTLVRKGDFLLFSPDRPYHMQFDSTCDRVGVVIPPDRLTKSIQSMATRLPLLVGSDPLSRVVGRTLRGLESEAALVSVSSQRRILDHAVDSLETLSRHVLTVADPLVEADAERLAAALDYIDVHLGDADLSVEQVARAVFVSVRTLYALFEAHRMSVAQTIRTRRLERCRRDLEDPLLADLPLAQIGSTWGFVSPSHFAAAFRQLFGVSPGEYRRRHRRDLATSAA